MTYLREMLTALLEEAEGSVNNDVPTLEQIADYLIAHGVTVQEWIPVTERLPKRFKSVILWDAIDEDAFMGELDGDDEWYIAGFQDEEFNITHWMPLPKPPKEVCND